MKLEYKKESKINKKTKNKNYQEKNNKLQKGITLIALVITIIVLLILAGVSIATLTGDNGIIGKAQNAKERTEIAQIIEQIRLNILENLKLNDGKITKEEFWNILSNYFHLEEKVMPEDVEELLNSEFVTKNGNYTIKVSEIYDGSFSDQILDVQVPGLPDKETGIFTRSSTIDGKEPSSSNPIIPKGFKPVKLSDDETIGKANWGDGTQAPSQEAINSGLVIEDIDENQFVWVPVANPVAKSEEEASATKSMAINKGNEKEPKYRGILYNFNTNSSTVIPSCTTTDKDYREPANSNFPGSIIENEEILQTQYNNAITNIEKYKGFYVGRYKMGVDNSDAENRKAISKNNVTMATADSTSGGFEDWIGLYSARTKFC